MQRTMVLGSHQKVDLKTDVPRSSATPTHFAKESPLSQSSSNRRNQPNRLDPVRNEDTMSVASFQSHPIVLTKNPPSRFGKMAEVPMIKPDAPRRGSLENIGKPMRFPGREYASSNISGEDPSWDESESSSRASHSRDAGKEVLEIGVAEDPNPRCRPTMEDAHVVIVNFGPKAAAREERSRPRRTAPHRRRDEDSGVDHSCFFAIYDGHGGRGVVEFLEKTLHVEVEKHLQISPPEKAIEDAFVATDNALARSDKFKDMGSTAVVGYIRHGPNGGRELYMANVGDAQAVLSTSDQQEGQRAAKTILPNQFKGKASAFRSGQWDDDDDTPPQPAFPDSGLSPVPLSYPHVATDAKEMLRIKQAGGRVFMGRVNGSLAVSRAFGDNSLKAAGVSVRPHLQKIQLTANHKFIIAGCDGVWDVVDAKEAIDCIARMKDATEMARRLVEFAIERGTTDNVSAMVIRLRDD